MQHIRNKVDGEEFDHLMLLECLSEYKQPRDKITKLLKNESIIRVKKGIYVFGKIYRRKPYSLEILSHLIYGPSYISYESALSYHGLIPEAVKRTTAATLKKNKLFKTPVGEFVYYCIKKEQFSVGLERVSNGSANYIFMASKEKAIADFISRLKMFSSESALLEYLVESLRIEMDALNNVNKALLKEIEEVYQNKNVTLLWKNLKK